MNVKAPLLLLLCFSSALSLRAQADPRRAGGKETYEWLHQYFSDEEILRDFYYFGIRDHEDDDVEYDYTAGTNREQLSRLFAPSAPMIGYARQARTLFEPSLRHEAPRGTLTVEAWNGGKMTVPYKTVNGRTIADGICRYTCTRAQLPEATGSHYEQETYSVSMTLHVKQGKAVGLGISGKRQLWKPDPRATKNCHTRTALRIALQNSKPIVHKTIIVRTKEDFPFRLDYCLHQCSDLFGHALPADEKETIRTLIYGFAQFSTYSTKFVEKHASLMLQPIDLSNLTWQE